MKSKEEYTRCEYCNKRISLASPPNTKRYNKAEIYIRNGSMLLPDEVVAKNHREGFTDSHSTSLDGYYCTPKCLIKRIKALLKVNSIVNVPVHITK
jgi:hypothetical protein